MELNKKIKKLYYFFQNPVYKLYCFMFRPKSLGVKVVIENDNKFLMVRIGYAHKKFTFPGGGVEKNESFEEAAKRELEEETGIKTQHLVEIGEYTSDRNFKKNIVKCFYLKIDSSFIKIDNFEIIEAGWYAPDQFPKNRSSSVSEIFNIYKNFKTKNI